GVGSVSGFTLGLGVIFGTVTALQAIATMKALELGPMSYSTVFICCSTLITALSGKFLFKTEDIAWPQYVGMGLMLISFFLALEKDKEKKSASLRWLAFCLLAFCCSGAVGIMQKTESTYHASEMGIFLVIAFAVAFLFSLLMALFLRHKSKKNPEEDGASPLIDKRLGARALLIPGCMVLMGICAGVNNKLNLFLAGELDSAVFFPIVNGGGLVLASLAAFVIFRERLSVKRWIGVVVGIASVILLCNPFQ
ncbi:MAG: EamA family transporter, partial [Clostridia bacterium]|nr:EamA family transporter [Clostridia bacterium]